MNPYDETNSAAWWVAGIVGFGVFIWKMVFNLRKDSRDDKEGISRQDFIDQLQEELRGKNDVIRNLYTALDEESDRRRAAEEKNFLCMQRENVLQRKIRELGGEVDDDD